MENQNQSESPVLQQTELIETNKTNKIWKIVTVVLISIIIIFCLLAWWGFNLQKQEKTQMQNQDATDFSKEKNIMKTKINLFDKEYRIGFRLPSVGGMGFTSISYEWITGSEDLKNWTSLITTQKLSPLSLDKPIEANIYASNVLNYNEERGAVVIDYYTWNDEKAAEAGIDVSNPPFINIYAYKLSDKTEPVEISIQKVQNIGNGEVGVFIYSERVYVSSDEELNKITTSDAFKKKIRAVMLARFPY